MDKKKLLLRIFCEVIVAALCLVFFAKELRELLIARELLSELRPVSIKDCKMKRFGNAHDGGYLVCVNLINDVSIAYSFGIDGRDEWGCDVWKNNGIAVHQYDCFNLKRPICEGAKFIFHEECIASSYEVDNEGRVFDTFASQLSKNGDVQGKLVVKMDVEGAEWKVLGEATEDILDRIAQISIEFHGFSDPFYSSVIRKLKTKFYVADTHFNNYSCNWYDVFGLIKFKGIGFPSWAFEVLLVNKNIAAIDEGALLSSDASNLSASNNPWGEDCQVKWD